MAEHVKFVSYSGKWPCLCSGTLVLNIDGKDYSFGSNFEKNKKHDFDCIFWSSGGWLGEDYEPHPAPWEFDKGQIPEQFQKYYDEIEEEFNNNVEFGCCGGCS